jgi:1-acyl-sn-glycerol-3-phosphate acyltransferase
MAVLGKKEHFDHWWTRIIANICHTIPVDRDQVSQKTFQICGEILKEGHILLIHPEGTRSPDGHLLPFKDGVAHLAYHHQCPVVPIYIEGSHEFWPKDSILPRHRSRITVTFLEPLPPPSCLEKSNPRLLQEKVHQITEELWSRVALFSGEKEPYSKNSPTTFESMDSSSASLHEGGQQ